MRIPVFAGVQPGKTYWHLQLHRLASLRILDIISIGKKGHFTSRSIRSFNGCEVRTEIPSRG